MKRFKEFKKENDDLGLGVLKNKINVLKWGIQLSGQKYYNEFTSLYSIPSVNIRTKRELVSFINSLSKNDIKNGYIVIYGQNVLPLNLSDFKNEIELSDLNILKLSHSYMVDGEDENKEDFIINGKRYTLEELKDIIKK